MKRLVVVLGVFVAICLALHAIVHRSFAEEADVADPSVNAVYLFTKEGCPYCYQATGYISKTYPDFKIEIRDIYEPGNLDLMLACAKRFKLDKSELGTPLICMPDQYILGWSSENQKKFDAFVAGQSK